MTRHARLAFAIFALAVLFLFPAPEAQAAWGYSDIYYNGSSTVEGYSATLRDWWESDWQECSSWEYDPNSGQWYCALAYYNAYWVSFAASLQAPWGTAWSGSDWGPWYAGGGSVVASDYGWWTQSGDHYMGDDVSYNQCWNANSCSGWQFLYTTWWSLGSSSASTYVAPPPPPPPGVPANPSPGNGTVNVLTSLTLTWSADGATSYDIAFGTANPPPAAAANLTAASYTPPPLNPGTTYYWKITAKNAGGSTGGPVWSFTTAVGAPTNPTPANGAVNVLTSLTLTWSASGAASYDIAFGTANPPPTAATNLTTASYTPAPLNPCTTYYWKVTAKSGGSQTPGPVWSFTTAVGAPANPGPANGAVNVLTNPTLTWSASGAVSYDLAFGTANPPPMAATNLTTASYTPAPLNPFTTYYWKITAKNGSCQTSGPVWSFTTGPPAITLTKEYIYLGNQTIAIEKPQ